ncbi:class I adenylate-forming enzyme family protein [Aquabacterium parvum]|uniref:class I adenylate-forming enzyme family protein n=1 Tax=Aquabacterium parvum TaxID=70584 RepID=UPI00128F3E03|nr:class I adenylate-forming enzyme family protein [Aquabacterium parvum]
MPAQHQTDGFIHRFIGFAESHPQATAIDALDEGRSCTYAELHEMATRRCGTLHALSQSCGTRVLLCMPSGIELVANYLAIVGAGLVPVLINDKLTAAELRELALASTPSMVVTTTALAVRHQGTWSMLNELSALITVDEGPCVPLPPNVRHIALPTQPLEARPLRLPQADDVVTIQFTYKGLGEPLGVAHRYGALSLSAAGLLKSMRPMGVGTVHLVGLPLYAVYGLVVLMVMPLSIGSTMLITSTLSRRDIAEVLSQHQVAFACLVPELVRMLNHQLSERAARGDATPPLHPDLMLYSGGSRLAPDAARELSQRLPAHQVLQGYGMTECLPVIVQSYVGPCKPDTLGRAIPGVQLRVVDGEGQDVPDGTLGELWIGGPTVCSGYLNNAEADRQFFCEGWLKSGDLVVRDEAGHVHFIGMRLRITKVRSQMVDLAEVEQAAREWPNVRAARAHAERDALGQTSLSLSVVCDAIDQEALLKHLGERLSAHKLPRNIVVVTEALATAA